MIADLKNNILLFNEDVEKKVANPDTGWRLYAL